MSAQHTPGPWSAHHDHGWLVVESSNGDMLIKIEKGSAAKKHMADALLIAAAPDLLDALQYLAADFRSVVNSEFATHRYPDPAKNDPAYLKAMAAIAKAIG